VTAPEQELWMLEENFYQVRVDNQGFPGPFEDGFEKLVLCFETFLDSDADY
jgi:hypothetical protein